MDEAQWLTSDGPAAMLRLYTSDAMPWPAGTEAPKVSDRKLRLFACACCRRIWHLLTDERSRRAVEVAERCADGLATEAALIRKAYTDAMLATDYSQPNPHWFPASSASWCASKDLSREIPRVAERFPGAASTQAALLREIIGNPFRTVKLPKKRDQIAIGPYEVDHYTVDTGWGNEYCPWLAWDDGLVVRLARAAYEERRDDGTLDPFRMLLVADALEEAGCPPYETCPDCLDESEYRVYCKTCEGSGCCGKIRHPVIAHLRSPGPHVRGCWTLDLILGKS